MNSSKQKIVFIGSGKVATTLSLALQGKREIVQVYSKTIAHAQKLGKKLGCSYTNDIKKISLDADLYIIAVKDDAIEDVCKNLKLPGKIVVHTSGSTSIDVLNHVSEKSGVLWAMFSFATNAKLTEGASFFIEASDKNIEKELMGLVEILNGKPYYMDSEKRAIAHLVAVFVNNFPNHLFTIAENLCKESGIPFNIFFPLAQETVENITKKSPALSQTGPASRHDKRILDKHLSLLASHPVYKHIYKVLTKSIISNGRKKL